LTPYSSSITVILSGISYSRTR